MTTNDLVALSVLAFVLIAAVLEWATGRSANGGRTAKDWQIAGLTTFMMIAVQRPLVLFLIGAGLSLMWPGSAGSLAWLESTYFWPTLIAFFCLEELIHGAGHYFAHCRRPKARWAQLAQAVFKHSHRPHHLSGSDDRGRLTATQTFTNGWLWWLIMPNYWFQLLCLYLGLTEVFLWGTVTKGLWAAHTHAGWNYDLYFHNHRWAWVRKTMWALAHVFTFPTQHHHHHARGRNSARNVCGSLALYDWLIFDTLAIEKEAPAIYGWRQSEREQRSVLYRYFNLDLRKYL
ncbi:sterol desaturase family protein [Marinobacter sp. CA1]|uniref:sterol desaturase family protein n=1 Tax=Marinobacter sp. CA1 TaxID=2817656 RepID=UPI001D0755B5|nr:sterol desaturase [Marinobacter sp. CA1]UDL06398.1 sterol desaturase [Marinobacter sp. CA1]